MGELIGGVAAPALLAVFFLDWFAAAGEGVSGWSGLSKVVLVLSCLAAALALGVVVVTATGRSVAIQIALDVGATVAAALAAIAIAVSLLFQPDLGGTSLRPPSICAGPPTPALPSRSPWRRGCGVRWPTSAWVLARAPTARRHRRR